MGVHNKHSWAFKSQAALAAAKFRTCARCLEDKDVLNFDAHDGTCKNCRSIEKSQHSDIDQKRHRELMVEIEKRQESKDLLLTDEDYWGDV